MTISTAFGTSGYGASAGDNYCSKIHHFGQDFSSAAEATDLEGPEVIRGNETGTYGLRIADGTVNRGYLSQSYPSSLGYGTEGDFAGGARFDAAAANFADADTTNNRTLDENEF